MQSSSRYEPTLGFGLLLVGPPKSGKTSTALQFPKAYIADCDNNLMGPVRRLRATQPNLEFGFDTINIDGDKQVPPHLRWDRLCKCCQTAAADPNIQTVIVDSLSSINDYLCDKIVYEKDSGKDRDKMTISDWIPFRNMLTKFITHFRSYPGKYFIMTAHELVEKDEVTGQIMYKPWISSKLQDNIGGFFSDVWLCMPDEFKGQMQYTIRPKPSANRKQVGNSFGMNADQFIFSWEEFKKVMEQGLFKK